MVIRVVKKEFTGFSPGPSLCPKEERVRIKKNEIIVLLGTTQYSGKGPSYVWFLTENGLIKDTDSDALEEGTVPLRE